MFKFILMSILNYSVFSFCEWDLNITKWCFFSRFVFLVIIILIIFLSEPKKTLDKLKNKKS
jgi:hypothetical protein